MNYKSITSSYLYIKGSPFQPMSNFQHLQGVFTQENSCSLIISNSKVILTKKTQYLNQAYHVNNQSINNSFVYIIGRSFQYVSNFQHQQGVFTQEYSSFILIFHNNAILTKKYAISVSSFTI